MSLIVTQVSRHGVVQVVDSNITRTDRDPVTGVETDHFDRQDSKVFEVPHLGAALAVAGSYRVGGEAMSSWMPWFIQSECGTSARNLQSFAEELTRWLACSMSKAEKGEGCLIHIAGHVIDKDGYHPELWFVRNYEGMDERGEYLPPSERFLVSEDFWHRDALLPDQWRAILAGDLYRYYVNGPLGARLAYNVLTGTIEPLFGHLWSQMSLGFRPPNNVHESALFAKAYHDLIAAAYVASSYPAPYVGGETRTLPLARPVGATPHQLHVPPYPRGPKYFD